MNKKEKEAGLQKKKGRVGKWIGRGLLAVLAALVIWVVVNWKDLSEFLQMPAGAYAQLMAQALFVEGRSEQEAASYARIPLPVGKVSIDYKAKTVTVEAYFSTATARYVDEKRGIILE